MYRRHLPRSREYTSPMWPVKATCTYRVCTCIVGFAFFYIMLALLCSAVILEESWGVFDRPLVHVHTMSLLRITTAQFQYPASSTHYLAWPGLALPCPAWPGLPCLVCPSLPCLACPALPCLAWPGLPCLPYLGTVPDFGCPILGEVIVWVFLKAVWQLYTSKLSPLGPNNPILPYLVKQKPRLFYVWKTESDRSAGSLFDCIQPTCLCNISSVCSSCCNWASFTWRGFV